MYLLLLKYLKIQDSKTMKTFSFLQCLQPYNKQINLSVVCTQYKIYFSFHTIIMYSQYDKSNIIVEPHMRINLYFVLKQVWQQTPCQIY